MWQCHLLRVARNKCRQKYTYFFQKCRQFLFFISQKVFENACLNLQKPLPVCCSGLRCLISFPANYSPANLLCKKRNISKHEKSKY